jgi:FkbM family methyltransferase
MFFFRSYSQWGEDSIVSQFIYDDDWTYIDIGSSHPVHGNDTFFLYRRGCRGILVDPIEHNQKLTQQIRPRDKFILGLISDNGEKKFYQFSNGGISTADATRAKTLQSLGNSIVAEFFPEVYSLTEIFETLSSGKKQILLKIDVEGLELNVLQSLDFDRYRPDLILVEELETLPREQTTLRTFLEERGYDLIISAYNSHFFKIKSRD